MTITRAPLRSAEDRYRGRSGYSAAECYVAEWWLHNKDSAGRLVPVRGREMPQGTALATSVPAHANRGRWVVQCPGHLPDGSKCWAAQLACREDHRFFCPMCGNHDHGGLWLTVDWHEDAAEIEEVLGMRPAKVNRNWLPHETVEGLRAENDGHGVR